MKILCIGDVTSPSAAEYLASVLEKFKRERGIDAAIVNAEHAGFVTGASRETAELLLLRGADCLTGGNHTLRNRSVYSFLDECDRVLRPINFGAGAPGVGYTVIDACGYRVLVISAMGTVHIDPVLDSPFGFIDRVLEREEGKYDFSVLDIHAEATGEKLAVAHAYDGKINCIFGTHTHVPTADAQILPRGTGYITDVGMCGERGGILGMDAERVVERMRARLPYPFKIADGALGADGVIVTLDEGSGRVVRVERVTL